MKTVLTGGGTAGHVTPNLALLPELKKRFDKIYYIGSEKGIESKLCADKSVEFYSLPVVKLDRSKIFSNVLIPVKLAKCVKEAKKLLKDLDPDVVFSKGGYVSLPVCLAAHSLKIPVVAHESDVTLGLANSIVSKFAECVITSHRGTKAKKSVFVGNPLRPELFKADGKRIAEKYGLPGKKPLLTVVGGSSGSAALNTFIAANLDRLTERFEIIHITGNNHENISKKGYYSKPYADDIFDIFDASDVIISRAGANAVAEISAMGKRVVYIPLPKAASRGDQIINAKAAQAKGIATVIEQEDLSVVKLLTALDNLMSSPPPKAEKEENVNARIAEIIFNAAKKSDRCKAAK